MKVFLMLCFRISNTLTLWMLLLMETKILSNLSSDTCSFTIRGRKLFTVQNKGGNVCVIYHKLAPQKKWHGKKWISHRTLCFVREQSRFRKVERGCMDYLSDVSSSANEGMLPLPHFLIQSKRAHFIVSRYCGNSAGKGISHDVVEGLHACFWLSDRRWLTYGAGLHCKRFRKFHSIVYFVVRL